MKTYKNIFVQVVAFDNLMLAHYHASKGKKHRDEVLIFEQRKQNTASSWETVWSSRPIR